MRAPLNVLLVEDSVEDAELLVLELTRGDYDVRPLRVDTAGGMREALKQQSWDLILCDYSMPHFDAIQALDILREARLDVPLILISGAVSEEMAFNALRAGARDFLSKSQLTRLLPAVARELRAVALRQDLQHIESERRATLQRYQELVESTPDGVWLVNHRLRTLHMNQRMADLLRVRPSLDVAIADAIVDSGEHGLPLDLRSCLEGRPQARELSMRRSDGSTFSASVTVSETASESDVEPGFLLVVRDLTDLKRTQEQLRQAQKMEAIGQLAGGVAHDFNNLLTVILGNTEIVCGELDSNHPLRAEMLEIQRAGQEAADLTRRLLTFSRRQILQSVVLDVNAIVTSTLHLLRRLIGAHIECVATLDPDLGSIEADPVQVEQILMNLAVNARDAMPDGGRLTVATTNVELDEAFVQAHFGARLGPHVMLQVRDTGCGMDPETLRRIFDPFFTTKGPAEGTGLGLATVYGAVKQSDGYIAVESTPGDGTTFQVYFPRTMRTATVTAPAIPIPCGPCGNETILLVDDDASIRGLLEKALTRSGYHVVVASDPKDALRRLGDARRADLLVTDVVMPGASGVDLYRSLSLTRPDLRVLYISGHTPEGTDHRALLEPGIAFLQKPFTTATLVAKVREQLDVRGAQAVDPPRRAEKENRGAG